MSKNPQILSLTEAIRKRPGMFIGGMGSKGIVNLLEGILSDCVEVSTAENYFFHITIEADYCYTIQLRASNSDLSTFEGTLNNENAFQHFHLKVCKTLSSQFDLTQTDENRIYLTFRLDSTVFHENIDYLELSENFLQWSILNRNCEVLLTDKRSKYPNQNHYNFPEGIRYLYRRIAKDALGKPQFEICFDGIINGIDYQIFLGYRTDWYPSPTVSSFANDVHTTCGGSLIDGIMEGLIAGCKKHVKDHQLTHLKIRKRKFSNGLMLVAAVRGKNLEYGGSFKQTLENEQIRKDAKKLVKKLTIEFIENNTEQVSKFLWRFDESQFTSAMYLD